MRVDVILSRDDGPVGAESRFTETGDLLLISLGRDAGRIVLVERPVAELFTLGHRICAHAEEKQAREAEDSLSDIADAEQDAARGLEQEHVEDDEAAREAHKHEDIESVIVNMHETAREDELG